MFNNSIFRLSLIIAVFISLAVFLASAKSLSPDLVLLESRDNYSKTSPRRDLPSRKVSSESIPQTEASQPEAVDSIESLKKELQDSQILITKLKAEVSKERRQAKLLELELKMSESQKEELQKELRSLKNKQAAAAQP